MAEDEAFAVVGEEPGGERLVEFAEEGGGGAAAQGRGVGEPERAAQDRADPQEVQGVGPERGQSAAHPEHQPLGRHRRVRPRRGDARQHLGGQERIASRPVQEVRDLPGYVLAEYVARQLGEGRVGQRPQGDRRRARSAAAQLRVLSAREQPQDRGGEQPCGHDVQGEPAQRIGPLDVVDRDQRGRARRALLDQLGQPFHQPDALVVVAA